MIEKSDFVIFDEMFWFRKKNLFINIKKMPRSDKLEYPCGNEADDYIGGWTQFLNDIF